MTLRQLMGHVAGLRGDGGDEEPLFSQRCERTIDALLNNIAAQSDLLIHREHRTIPTWVLAETPASQK